MLTILIFFCQLIHFFTIFYFFLNIDNLLIYNCENLDNCLLFYHFTMTFKSDTKHRLHFLQCFLYQTNRFLTRSICPFGHNDFEYFSSDIGEIVIHKNCPKGDRNQEVFVRFCAAFILFAQIRDFSSFLSC